MESFIASLALDYFIFFIPQSFKLTPSDSCCGIDAHRGPRFNQASLVLEAAILGRGVALAKSTLADADIDSGRLVKPFDLTLPVRFAYYVVHPPAKGLLPKVRQFKEWLHAQAPEPD